MKLNHSTVINHMDRYLNKNDWREKENANQSFCFTSFINNVSGKLISNYSFDKVYNDDISQKLVEYHNQGKVHIHDLGHGIIGYCSGWSLGRLLSEGIPSIKNNVEANPAEHFRSAVDQMTNFIMITSNEWSGAMAFSDVDIYLAPYIYNDYKNMKNEIAREFSKSSGIIDSNDFENVISNIALDRIEAEVRQTLQSLFFNLNYPSRYGNQSPFSNFTLALTTPEDMKDKPAMIANRALKNDNGEFLKYDDFQEWVDFFNRIFFEEMNKGDAKGRVFTFPVITINMPEEFFTNVSNPVKHEIYKNIKKFGGPYITNQVNGMMSKEKRLSTSDTRSMCCRLMMDLDELRAHSGGLFGNGESTGSLGVVSISLPAIAYESDGDWEKFFNILMETMETSAYGLIKKREMVLDMYEKDLMPYTKHYLQGKFNNYFNTIGYVGLTEALKNMGIEGGVSSDEGLNRSEEILDFMLKLTMNFQHQYNTLFNLEATPAEGASYRMARAMQRNYPGIILSGDEETPMITNSCHPNVEDQGNFFELAENQDRLQKYHSGGTVLHFYIEDDLTIVDDKTIEVLLKKIVYNTTIPYFSFTSVFSVCPVCGYIGSKEDYCPNNHTEAQLVKYGENVGNEIKIPCEVFARIVGYFKSTESFHDGKQKEFKDRKYITINDKEKEQE